MSGKRSLRGRTTRRRVYLSSTRSVLSFGRKASPTPTPSSVDCAIRSASFSAFARATAPMPVEKTCESAPRVIAAMVKATSTSMSVNPPSLLGASVVMSVMHGNPSGEPIDQDVVVRVAAGQRHPAARRAAVGIETDRADAGRELLLRRCEQRETDARRQAHRRAAGRPIAGPVGIDQKDLLAVFRDGAAAHRAERGAHGGRRRAQLRASLAA